MYCCPHFECDRFPGEIRIGVHVVLRWILRITPITGLESFLGGNHGICLGPIRERKIQLGHSRGCTRSFLKHLDNRGSNRGDWDISRVRYGDELRRPGYRDQIRGNRAGRRGRGLNGGIQSNLLDGLHTGQEGDRFPTSTGEGLHNRSLGSVRILI